MQVQTHFIFNSAEEHAAFCKHMGAFVFAPAAEEKDVATDKAPPPAQPAKEETVKVEAPRVETPKTETVKETAAPAKPKTNNQKLAEVQEKAKAEAEAQPTEPGRLDTEPNYENVKKAVLAVSVKYKTKKPAFDILATFGIEKVTPAIPEEHYAAIIEACQKSIDAAE